MEVLLIKLVKKEEVKEVSDEKITGFTRVEFSWVEQVSY